MAKGRKLECSIFIPIYNEAGTIRHSVGTIVDFSSRFFTDYEIFIVDDGSTDSSPQICRSISLRNPAVHYLRYANGPSRRENMARSFRYASKEVIAFVDSDLATDMAALKPLVYAIMGGYDISIGNRYHRRSLTRRTAMRWLISRTYNLFIGLLCGSRIRDHNCGFKAFKRKVALNLSKAAGYDHTLTRGWFWDAEILVIAQILGYRIKEIPVRWREGAKSSFNFRREAKLVAYFIRFLLRLYWSRDCFPSHRTGTPK